MKYYKDEYFFKDSNCLNSYWAGFLAADGCITDHKCIIIRLTATDKNHIEKFVDDIKYNGLIKTYKPHSKIYKSKPCSSVTICGSGQLINDLERNFSITQNKTLTLQPPKITSTDHIFSFIAGYIDGDGCIRVGGRRQITPSIEILGTKPFLEWIKSVCDKEFIQRKSVANVQKKKNYYVYTINSSRSVLLNNKVQKLGLPLMQRKWGKFNVCKQ